MRKKKWLRLKVADAGFLYRKSHPFHFRFEILWQYRPSGFFFSSSSYSKDLWMKRIYTKEIACIPIYRISRNEVRYFTPQTSLLHFWSHDNIFINDSLYLKIFFFSPHSVLVLSKHVCLLFPFVMLSKQWVRFLTVRLTDNLDFRTADFMGVGRLDPTDPGMSANQI